MPPNYLLVSPKQIYLTNYLTSSATNVQCTLRMSQEEYKQTKISACSARNTVLYRHSQTDGTARYCDG